MGIKDVLVEVKRDNTVIPTVKPPNSLLTNKWLDVIIDKTSEIKEHHIHLGALIEW